MGSKLVWGVEYSGEKGADAFTGLPGDSRNGDGVGKETKTARRVYVVEWGAVRDGSQPGVPKSGQGLFASQMAHCLRICGQRGKNGRMVINRRDLIGWLGPKGGSQALYLTLGTWIDTRSRSAWALLGFTAL